MARAERVYIDCHTCGGSGSECIACRNRGKVLRAVWIPCGMPSILRGDFERERENCPCYEGICVNEGVAQCLHAKNSSAGRSCAVEYCPALKEEPDAPASDRVTLEEVRDWHYDQAKRYKDAGSTYEAIQSHVRMGKAIDLCLASTSKDAARWRHVRSTAFREFDSEGIWLRFAAIRHYEGPSDRLNERFVDSLVDAAMAAGRGEVG